MKYFSKIAIALVLVFGIFAASAQQAEAGRKGRIIAGTILGAIALGVLADRYGYADDYGYEDRCYKGERVCRKKRVCWEDRYGDERCKWKRKCYRPTYCD